MPEKTKRPRPTKKKFLYISFVWFFLWCWFESSHRMCTVIACMKTIWYFRFAWFWIEMIIFTNYVWSCFIANIESISRLYDIYMKRNACIQNECGFNQWAKFYPWQIVFVRHQKCFAKRTKQMQKWWNSLQHFMHMQKNHNDDQNTSHLRNENELFQLQANAIYIRQNVRNSSQYHLHECICDRKSPLQFRSGQNIVAFSVYKFSSLSVVVCMHFGFSLRNSWFARIIIYHKTK